MVPLQPEVAAFAATAAPAAPTAAPGGGPLFRCRPLRSGSCTSSENPGGGRSPRKKRRAPTPSCPTGTATQQADGGATSTAIQRRVRNMQIKHFDPSTGRFVFRSFAQQLQQQLQHHVSPLHRTGALDLLEEQHILSRHKVGCAGIPRLVSADDGVARGKLQSASDLDYSAFRAMIQDHMFVRNPPYLAALLAELQPLSSTLPLLLLEKERVVQVLLSHIVHEDCCTVVLALFPALAKDLRAELVPYLPSIFSTLLLVLQQSQTAADAEGVNRLFGCVSNLLRYLAKPLLKDFRALLHLYLPWLCGVSAAPGDVPSCSETYEQAQECRSLRQRALPPSADAGPSPEVVSKSLPSVADGAGGKVCESKASKKTRLLSGGSRRTPQVQVLAAQAFACLLRKAATDEDEGTLLSCVNELMMCFSRCSPASWPVLAESFGRVLFETVRNFHRTLSSSFDRLLRFLLASVLFQKPYRDANTGVEYAPASAARTDPDTSGVAHPLTREKDVCSGGLQPKEEKEIVATRERKRRRRLDAEDSSVEKRSEAEETASAEPVCEEEARCGRTAEQSGQTRLGKGSMTFDVSQNGSRRSNLYDGDEELAEALEASASNENKTSPNCSYFYQVKCVETLITLVRLHAGNMQSKAAIEVQTLLLEFLGAALRASSATSKDCVKPSGKAKARAASNEYSLTKAFDRDSCRTRSSSSSACDYGDSQIHLTCGQECHTPESPDFDSFLHSSFLSYFYERPSPRPLSSHPYFRSCGRWLSASEPDTSTLPRKESGAGDETCRSLSSLISVQPPLPASTRMKNVFFLGFGLLTLLEFVGDWFTAIPRLEGNADAFAERLLRILAPYALPGNSREGSDLKSNQKVCTPDVVHNTPPILHSLLYLIRLASAKTISCAVLRGDTSQKNVSELPRLRETTAVFAVTIPCALLRLIAITWRATPKSFVTAITKVAPDLLSSLLPGPQVWAQFSRAFYQQPDLCEADIFPTPPQQILPLTESFYSGICWRRRLAEVYLDCCLAFVALLQHPELLVAEPETDTNRGRGSVDGFTALALRPAFEFLVLCFSSRLPEVSATNASGDAVAQSLSSHTDHSRGYVITCLHWRRSACGVLLAEELRSFTDILMSERVLWSTGAYVLRCLNALMSALDELWCWVRACDSGDVILPTYATCQGEGTQADLFMYAWGLMTWAKALIAWLSTLKADDSGLQSAKLLPGPNGNEKSLIHVCRGISARLKNFVLYALIGIARELTVFTKEENNGELDVETERGNQEKVITMEGQKGCTGVIRHIKTDISDEPKARAKCTDERFLVIALQVVRRCLDCLFTLEIDCPFLGTGTADPSWGIFHVQRLLQRLKTVHASNGGDGCEGCSKGCATNGVSEGRCTPIFSGLATEATSKSYFMAFYTLNVLLRTYRVSADSSDRDADNLKLTRADDVASLRMLTLSPVEGSQGKKNCADVVSAAAQWVVLLLAVFNATSFAESSSSEKSLVLPLLQCSLECLQRFVKTAQHQACWTTEGNAVASTMTDVAAENFSKESEESVMEMISTSADNALGYHSAMVLSAISASLPALLACLSAPCRSLRLTVGRFFLHCNTLCRLLALNEAAPPGHKAALTSTLSATLDASGWMLVDDGALIFFSSYRELFQLIVDLESTEVGLSEERRLTRLVEQLGLSGLPAFQEVNQRFTEQMPPSRNPNSVAGCSGFQKKFTPPVLLGLACAVRVLVAQFSVKFTPLWPAAVDALVGLAQQAAIVDTRSTRSLGSKAVGADSVKAACLSGPSVLRGMSESEQPLSVLAENLLLPTMWRILLRDVRRAEDMLDQWHALAHSDYNRRSRVQQRGKQKQYAEKLVCGSVHEHEGDLSSSNNSPSPADCGSGGNGALSLRGRSGSRAIVFAACYEADAESADNGHLLGSGTRESDPLSRHTQLLRVIENINRITVADADVNGDIPGRSPKPLEGTPGSAQECEDEPVTQSVHDETREYSAITCETSNTVGRAEAPSTTLRGENQGLPEAALPAGSRAPWNATYTSRAIRIRLLWRKEELKRTCWTLFEALRLVGALVGGISEEWYDEAAGHANAGATRRKTGRQDKVALVAALGFAPLHTSRVSLVPRACNVLRAVVALGTTHVPCRFSRKLRKLSQRARISSDESRRDVCQADDIYSIDEWEDYASLADVVTAFWDRLLACCAQRLITIADPTLQQLSIQILQLSPSLRSRLQPYAPALDQLIANKSISDLLLRVRITDTRQRDFKLRFHDAMQPDEDEDEELERHAEGRNFVCSNDAHAPLQGEIVILKDDKDVVFPLLVRLLLTKVQQRATKRSSSTSFSLRRTILSFISSVAVEELPLVLAVLLHPLTSAERNSTRLPASSMKGHDAVRPTQENTTGDGRESATTDSSSATVNHGSKDGAGVSIITDGSISEADLPVFTTREAKELITGFAKEEALRRVVFDRTCLPAIGVKRGEEKLLDQADEFPREATRDGQSTSLSADTETVTPKLGDIKNSSVKSDAALLIAETQLPDGSSIAITLAPACLPPQPLTRLRGSLETLKHLQELIGKLLYPAAPFLVQFYCTILRQLAVRRTFAEVCYDDASTGAMTSAGSELGRRNAKEAVSPAKSVYQRAVVQSTLYLLKELLHLFPDEATTWQELLRPAGSVLQQLLDAAIETAAASPAYNGGPGKSGIREKKSIPAIISLVASWAAHPAYYGFFTTILPNALTALFKVPSAPSVLRAVCSRNCTTQKNSVFAGMNLGVLDAAIDVALHLSRGTSVEEQEQHFSGPSHGCRRWRSHHSKDRTRSRIMRKRGSESSSEAEDFDCEKEEPPSALTSTLTRQNAAAWEREQQDLCRAAQYQHEGMTVLRPYLPGLLRSLEILFQQRSKSAQHVTEALASGPSQATHAHAGVTSHCEDSGPDPVRDVSCGKTSNRGRGCPSVMLRVKELQLLTHIAQYTADKYEESQELIRPRGAVTAQGCGMHADTPASAVTLEESNLTCSLVRLLLQCLWSCPSEGRAARHVGGVDELRRVLTLQALRRLTLPLAMQVRALLTKTVCGIPQRQSSELLDSGEATAYDVVKGRTQCISEESCRDFGTDFEEKHTWVSDASIDALRSTIRSCCRLLQEASTMQCRVATSELLLAAELASCGLSHSDELFNALRDQVGVYLRQNEGGEISNLRTFGENAGCEETEGLPRRDLVVDALLPGGKIFEAFLQQAVALSHSKTRGDDSDPRVNETVCQNQDASPETTAWAAKSGTTCGELKNSQRPLGERHNFSNAAAPVVSVLAGSRRRQTIACIVANSESTCNQEPSHSGSSHSVEEDLLAWTQWHLGVGLVLLSLNAVKSCSQKLVSHPTIGEGDEVPDSDVQIIILSSLAERCIDIQVRFRPLSPSAVKNKMYRKLCGAAKEGGWNDARALQEFRRHTLAASAAEPLARQCLYLLSSPVVEWSVQQAALNIIKRLVCAAVSCATQYSSAIKSHCNSSSVDAASSLTCSSTSTCPAVVALPDESGSKSMGTSYDTERDFSRLWQAVSSHASGILSLLEDSVMPFAYFQLKQSDEDQWKTGVQILEHIVRSFAPAAPDLASLTVLSERCSTAAADCCVANTRKRLTHLQRVFCLDLACVLLRTPTTHSSIGMLTSEKSDDGVAGTVAAQAMISAASSRNAGGDFFIDVLHVQRHRRGRALQRMTGAVEAGLLSRRTLQTVVLPLSLGAVLQCESCVSKKQTQRRGQLRHLFHQGLCEQGLKCLEACCARIPWRRCLRAIQVLAGFLIRLPEREAYIYKAICGAVRAFEEHVRRVCGEVGVTETSSAAPADSDFDADMQSSQHRPRKEQKSRGPRDGCADRALGATALDVHFVNSAEIAVPPVSVENIEDGNRNIGVTVCTESLTGGICEGGVPGHPTPLGVRMLERLQACVRAELLPLLLRLAFRRRQMKSAKQSTPVDACSGGPRSCERVRGKDEDGKEMNPTLVVVCIILIRLLPPAVFEEELPRLIRMVGLRLRSREREVRRQARGALVSVAVQLGIKHLPFLVRELSAIMRSTNTKGNRSQEEEGAVPKGSQAFFNSVLLFTLHAVIHNVIHPQHIQDSQASDENATPLQHCGKTTPAVKGGMTDIIRSSGASATEKSSSAADEKMTAGFFDEAFPILLPLVAEELFRTYDPDRPSETALKTDKQSAKHDEAKHMKGAGIIFLLASVCSPASCEELLIPFFSALLTGRKLVCVWSGGELQPCESSRQQKMIIRQRQGFSSAAAFSSAYLERIRELLFYLVKGLNVNSGLTVGFKVKLSRRLLVVATSIMQQQCIHPIRQLRCRRKELLELALAQQQVELSTSRFAGPSVQGAHVDVRNNSDGTRLSCTTRPLLEAEAQGVQLIAGDRERPHFLGPKEVVAKSRHARGTTLYYEAVKDDLKFFWNVLLLAPEPGAPGSASHNTFKDERATFFLELDTSSETSLAVRFADLDRRERLRLAVATRKDKMMLTQPGAASGMSLEQAGAAHRTAKGRGGGGFEDSSRAATIGEAALRLLLVTLKKHKTILYDRRNTLSPKRHTEKHLKLKNHGESGNSAVHEDVPEKNSHNTALLYELEKCVENVVCCMCSTDNNLIAWSARCLIYMIGLKLREVTRLGCVVSYSALKIFQMVGEIATASQQKQQQMLLAPCTRLLTLLLLRPHASLWLDKALYGGRDIPRTQGEFLRQQMRKQGQHQVKVARARQKLFCTAPTTETHLTKDESRNTPMTDHSGDGHKVHTAGNIDARFATQEELVARGHEGNDMYTQLQAQLLQAEREELPVTADAKQQQVKFREALLAQITHALEHPQTRLSAVMLFKSVVLPHYREVAAETMNRKDENGLSDDFTEDSGPKTDHSLNAAPWKKGSLAECCLLKEVYRCVDVIARLMIQEAGDVGESKRLAELSADVYVQFLLNFPMTVKAQQRKLLFLIKNLGYTTVDGRRAVLNCIHKILSRFPYELTMEKYSEVMMVSLCRRLVLEDDSVTHSMLRMLVGQIMQISEDLQDGRHSSLSVLRICVEILLQPKATNLLAIEELILVFIDLQLGLPEQNAALKVLPYLHRTLELSETAHNASMNLDAPGVVSCCKHGCCDGVDWRVCYKALLIFEKLMLSVHPSELDKVFAKMVTAIQQTYRSPDATHRSRGTPKGLSGPSVRLIKLLHNCRSPAADDAYKDTTLFVGDLSEGMDEMSGTVPALQTGEAQNLEAETDASASVETALRMDSVEAANALALSRLWRLAAGVGIEHNHPWIRAASFRCAGIYLGARVYSGLNRNGPCLLYLPLDDLSQPGGSGLTVRKFSRNRIEHSIKVQVDKETNLHQERASFQGRIPRATVTERTQRPGCYLSPGAKLFLSAVKALGEDEFLERSPQAVPAVYAFFVPLLKLAAESPDLFHFAHAGGADVLRWQSVVEQAGNSSPNNVCGWHGSSSIETKSSVHLDDPLTVSVCRNQVKETFFTDVGRNEARAERRGGNGKTFPEKQPNCRGSLNELKTSLQSAAGGSGETTECRSWKRMTIDEVSKNTMCSAGTVLQTGREGETTAITFPAFKGTDEAKSAELWAAPFQSDSHMLDSTGDTQQRRTTEAAEISPHSKLVFSACDKSTTAVAGTPAYLRLQGSTHPASGADCEGEAEGRSTLTDAIATGLLDGCCTSTHGCSLRAASLQVVKGTTHAAGVDVDLLQALNTVTSGPGLSENGLQSAKRIQQKAFQLTSVEDVHPLVVIVRKMCFWLRLHLGSLGKRALYEKSSGIARKRSVIDASALTSSTSITRVGAILAILHCVLYMLPMSPSSSRKESAGKRVLLTRPDRKRKLEDTEANPPQKVHVLRDESESGCSSSSLKLGDSSYDGEARSEGWIHRVILFILEVFFRCSTLVRDEASLRQSSSKAEYLVKMLAVLQEHFVGQKGQALYAHVQQAKHQWEQLTALNPKEQQAEVVAAGAYLLDCFRTKMGAVGMDDLFLQLLAKVRQKVLKQRMERKVQLRQRAVVQPQRFAETRRKRQQRKALVKSAAILSRKRKRMLNKS